MGWIMQGPGPGEVESQWLNDTTVGAARDGWEGGGGGDSYPRELDRGGLERGSRRQNCLGGGGEQCAQGKTQLIDRWAPTHSQSGSLLQASEWRVLRPWPRPLADPSPPGLAEPAERFGHSHETTGK